MKTNSPSPVRGDATREALISSALEIFARDGFNATSTRAIAEAAGVNQALIGYHFGGKEGLYLAVFDYIANQLQARIGPAAHKAQALLAEAPATPTAKERQKLWLPQIFALVDEAIATILSPETEHWAELMVREQARPTQAFDNIYSSVLHPLLTLLMQLIARLRNESDLERVRLQVMSLFGQAIVWRTTRATTERFLGWSELGESEIRQIRDLLFTSIEAQLLTEETK